MKDGAPEATTPSAPALEAESHVGEVLATVMTEVGAQAVEHGLEGGLLPKIAGEYAGGASVNVELLGGLYKNVALVGPAVGVIVDVVRGEDPSRIAVVNGSAAIGSVLAGSSGAVVGSWIGQTVHDDNQDPGLHPFILSGAIAGGTVGALGGLETAGAGAVAGALAGDLMGNVVRDDGNASMRPYIRGGAIAGAFLGSEGGPLGVLAGSFVGGVAGDIEARAVGHSGATTPPPLTDDEVPAVDNPNAD